MKIHDESNVPEFLKMLDELSNGEIKIGILGDGKGGEKQKDREGKVREATVVQIANYHEFGKGHNPERSFMRASFDINKNDYMNQGEGLLESVMRLETPVAIFYETLGQHIVGRTQEYLTELSDPPNAPATIKMKKSSQPLIDTGQLRDSIEWKKV